MLLHNFPYEIMFSALISKIRKLMTWFNRNFIF